MAEEELVASAAASPTAIAESHKRKLEDIELNNPPEPLIESKPISDPDPVNNAADGEENGEESDAKRPRLESNGDNVDEPDGAVSQNGHHEDQKADEPEEEDPEEEDPEEEAQPESVDNNSVSMEGQEAAKEPLATVTEEPAPHKDKPEDTSTEDVTQSKTDVEELSQGLAQTVSEVGIPSEELPREGDVPVSFTDPEPGSDTQVLSRRIEVPNDKVGVLIGKAGDTIRSLQDNSGAKIQIVRDADADPRAVTRPIELVGTLQNINRAEKLIKDVIAEADAGGSPSLVARGFGTVPGASGEQVEIQVPIEKVGLIIGKGGETIRNLQTRSGARIQLIQLNPSEGNPSGERTVRITGNKKQIENAREMIKDVMNQTVRPSPLSGGHNQHGYRPRGPVSPQWGPRGPHPQFSGGYNNYPQRGPYPSYGSQYPPAYGNYPSQQIPRGNFGPNWEQRPPTSMHGPSHQGNYNYGQQQGPDYGNPPLYSQQPQHAPQSYVGQQGYNEVNHHAPSQPYGQMGGSQPMPYSQGGGSHPGYGQQDQYGKPPMYGQPPHSQQYVQPRPTSQPGEVPYQGPIPSTQPPPYTQNPPPQQQSYPTGPIQPTPYSQGVQPVTTGYNQPLPGTAYPQQQQAAGGYGSYPTAAQYGYPEQQQPAATNIAAYGYQDPNAAYGTYPAPAAGQAGYGQLVAVAQGPTPTYDQSTAAGYGNPPAAPAQTNMSPHPGAAAYPQYDVTGQMYGAHSSS